MQDHNCTYNKISAQPKNFYCHFPSFPTENSYQNTPSGCKTHTQLKRDVRYMISADAFLIFTLSELKLFQRSRNPSAAGGPNCIIHREIQRRSRRKCHSIFGLLWNWFLNAWCRHGRTKTKERVSRRRRCDAIFEMNWVRCGVNPMSYGGGDDDDDEEDAEICHLSLRDGWVLWICWVRLEELGIFPDFVWNKFVGKLTCTEYLVLIYWFNYLLRIFCLLPFFVKKTLYTFQSISMNLMHWTNCGRCKTWNIYCFFNTHIIWKIQFDLENIEITRNPERVSYNCHFSR